MLTKAQATLESCSKLLTLSHSVFNAAAACWNDASILAAAAVIHKHLDLAYQVQTSDLSWFAVNLVIQAVLHPMHTWRHVYSSDANRKSRTCGLRQGPETCAVSWQLSIIIGLKHEPIQEILLLMPPNVYGVKYAHHHQAQTILASLLMLHSH